MKKLFVVLSMLIMFGLFAEEKFPDGIKTKKLKFYNATELTISSGVILMTQTCHTIDTEGDAASDDLDTITATNASAETICYFKQANSGRNIVFKNGTGNIITGANDFTLENGDAVAFLYDGSNWLLAGGGGSVSTEGSSTDNAFVIWDGTGGNKLKDSTILYDTGSINVATGEDYQINSASVLNATTLGSSVVNSSLTSLGILNSCTWDTTPSGITGHTAGRIYYDDTWKTFAAQIGAAVTLQVGQEEVYFVYNNSGGDIDEGEIVYATGAGDDGAGGTTTVTIDLAQADAAATADCTMGVATENITNGSYGMVTSRGMVTDIDTSGLSGAAGSEVYLSAATPGAFTSTSPEAPNLSIRVGILVIKDATTGKICVNVQQVLQLEDLADTTISSPSVDQILKYNGVSWINGDPGAVSAGKGIEFFNCTPVVTAVSSPAGISQDGTAGNGVQINSLCKTPVVTAEQTQAGAAVSDTRLYIAWFYDTAIGRTTLDAGVWGFDFWAHVSSVGAGSTTSITKAIYQIVPGTDTVTTSGVGANSRTATITSTQFDGTYFSANATNTTASYLQTPTGIYQITAISDTNTATITVPTGYSNETTVAFKIWNKLFAADAITITSVTPNYANYKESTTQGAFTVAATDKLGEMAFVTSDNTRTVTTTYNGTSRQGTFTTPLITLHNNLAGLQGGAANEYYHLDATDNTALTTSTQGDIWYSSATNTLAKLGIGTALQYLRTNAGATAPEWTTLATSIYTTTFVDGDLAAGVLTVNHALAQQHVWVNVIGDSEEDVPLATLITYTDANNLDIDLSGYTMGAETWTVIVSTGAAGAGIASGAGIDTTAIHDNVAGEIVVVTEKTTGIAADEVLIEDSADSNNKKSLKLGAIPKTGVYRTIYIDAGAMVSCTTNGAATGTNEYGTNDIDWDYFAFDTGATEERVQFKFAFPDEWDLSTVKVKFYWSSDTGSTTGDTVEWGIKAGALADSDAIDTALGSAVTISDVLLADNGTDLQITSATGALTVAGTPALGELTTFEVYRNTDGTDDMAEDAWLVGVSIQYKESAVEPSQW